MAFSVLSFVYITYRQLNTKEAKHQAVKKQNRTAGFLSSTFSVRIGNMMMIREAQIQLVAVEKGTIFGCTISGMYSHTMGPKDRPKTAM